ncbi:MAG TPA: AMP-binding protein, partial [Candidatus Norongarragalinales archaeon]|nr:AMP-binding protein [Candidatus Norongarragalinales archaeon]
MPDHSPTIHSSLEENRIFQPPASVSINAHVKSLEEYKKIYQESIADPESFWKKHASSLYWFRPFDKVLEGTMPSCRWFLGGKTNAAYNCLDRHLARRKNKAALIWEGDDGQSHTLTFQQLHREVCRFANVLKSHGLKSGDVACLYLPMVPELAIAMLACARIGVTHSIVFGGFSAQALKDRIQDCKAQIVITADGGFRGGKIVPLKVNVDEALSECPSVQIVVVVRRTGNAIFMKENRDVWWNDAMQNAPAACPAEEVDSEHPLFILYTSGTTGKPKGILHTTAGYLLYASMTCKYVFDLHENDTHFCTADIG